MTRQTPFTIAGFALLLCLNSPIPCLTPQEALAIDRNDLQSPRTTFEARAAFLAEQRAVTIGDRLSQPLTATREEEWCGAFWAANLIGENTPVVQRAISEVIGSWNDVGHSLKRWTLESIHTLFPHDFALELRGLLPLEEDPKLFAMIAYHVLRVEPDSKEWLRETLTLAFPDWEENAILASLHHRLTSDPAVETAARPPLQDLIRRMALERRPVIFSLQRIDRAQPGLAVVLGADGRFVQEEGRIFAVPHLALAVSDMPGTITNGNAPEGIYSIVGTDISDNVFIGPTPNLQSRLPFEVSAEVFSHGDFRGLEWSRGLYAALLPAAWQRYHPIWEAWRAGQAGRSEIIVHGTTINPDYYADAPYHPLTPSLGCLTAKEIWSTEDGSLLESDQLALVHAFLRAAPDGLGYLVVINLDWGSAPVTLGEVREELLSGEWPM